MNKLILALGILIPLPLAAEVPHTFSAGTPARAAEVNDNFSNLDSRLSTLEDSLSQANSHYPITYSYKPSAIGDRITVGATNFRIVNVPVKEFSSGKVFHVSYPELAKGNSGEDELVYSYTASLHATAPTVSNATISGHPAHLSVEVIRYLTSSFADDRSNDHYNNITSMFIARGIINLQIEETWVRIPLEIVKNEIYRAPITDGLDFSASTNTDLMGDHLDITQGIDDLVDYIVITEIR